MASQTDRKEEFRKYLDKGNVLSILTNVLTDLFELEPKPEDPALYLYEKIGEAVKKVKTTNANHTEPNSQKDVEMKDTSQTPVQPTKASEADTATQQKPAQESVETKPAPSEQTDPQSQQPTQPEPTSAAAPTAAAPKAPLSVPATTQ